MLLRYRPTLETLERRWTPAVVVTTGIDLDSDGQTDDLRIVGDANNSQLFIRDDDGDTLLIDLDKNGDGDFTDSGEFIDLTQSPADGTIALDIRLGDGNDLMEYFINGDWSAERRALAIDLGPGSDTFTLLSAGTLTNSSEMTLDLLAGKGGDTLDLELPNVAGSLLAVQVGVGGGFDVVDLETGSIDTLGSVDVDLDLGGGSNECALVVFNPVGATAAGYLDLDVIGGDSATVSDTVFLSMGAAYGGGSQLSTVSVDVDLQGGNDTFLGGWQLSGFDVEALGVVDLSVQGGAGNDQITLDQLGAGTMTIDPSGLLEVVLKGGTGNDTLTVDFSAAGSLDVDGRLQLRVAGNDGSDTITVNVQLLAGFVGSIGNLDIAIRGNGGNDTVTYDLETNGASVTFGPAGVALLDGGLGSDTLDDNSDPAQSDHQLFEVFV